MEKGSTLLAEIERMERLHNELTLLLRNKDTCNQPLWDLVYRGALVEYAECHMAVHAAVGVQEDPPKETPAAPRIVELAQEIIRRVEADPELHCEATLETLNAAKRGIGKIVMTAQLHRIFPGAEIHIETVGSSPRERRH